MDKAYDEVQLAVENLFQAIDRRALGQIVNGEKPVDGYIFDNIHYGMRISAVPLTDERLEDLQRLQDEVLRNDDN